MLVDIRSDCQLTSNGLAFVTVVAATTNITAEMDPPIQILKYIDLNHGVGEAPAWVKKNQKQSSVDRSHEMIQNYRCFSVTSKTSCLPSRCDILSY